MALIYGLMRAVAAAMTRLAMWQNHRAMKKLEVADSQFRKIETDCKADEVAVGRPADYPTQIRLLREFEKREAAHVSWTRATNRLKKRKRFQRWLVKLSGRKIPYTFGLIDMALGMKLIEVAYRHHWNFNVMSDWVAGLF